MDRITADNLAGMFARFVKAGERAGFPNTRQWALTEGIKSQGIAYRVFEVVEHGGHRDLPFMSASGYLGMTRREAYEALGFMARTMEAVADLHRDAK